SLLSLLSTPEGYAIDPIRRADAVADGLSGNITFRMRIWGGDASLSPSNQRSASMNPLSYGIVPSLGSTKPDHYTDGFGHTWYGEFVVFDPSKLIFAPRPPGPTWNVCRYTWT